jgi:hypothetical protein
MKMVSRLGLLLLVFTADTYAQTTAAGPNGSPTPLVLSSRVVHFDLTNATLIDALSKLSREPIPDLHLGIEEIIQGENSHPVDRSVRFSLSLHDVTVRDIIDTLCKFDSRYIWSVDGSSVNVYPGETVGNSSYLLNRVLDSIALENIYRPSDALTALMKLLPDEQLGYAGIGIGIDNDYPKPWNAVFFNLTVRQLMNRLSEHNGPNRGWIWSGSTGQRFFGYFQHGFIIGGG